jgi:structural maintenance of chromosomes protein 5
MARGGRSSTSNGAPRTGPTSVKVKNEKMKEEKKNKGKQRAYEEEEEEEEEQQTPNANGKHDDDDEEQDAEGEMDEDEQGGSPKGTKRSRVNEDGDSRPADKGKFKERVKTLPRDDDG